MERGAPNEREEKKMKRLENKLIASYYVRCIQETLRSLLLLLLLLLLPLPVAAVRRSSVVRVYPSFGIRAIVCRSRHQKHHPTHFYTSCLLSLCVRAFASCTRPIDSG